MRLYFGNIVLLIFTTLPLVLLVITGAQAQEGLVGQCLSNAELERQFPNAGTTCCQYDICGIPCAEPVEPPPNGYGIAVGLSIAVSFVVGVWSYVFIKGESVNFFVAGRSLPMWMVGVTLAACAVDSNALLGNADAAFKYQFWDGAVLPIGLAMSLFINGLLLAHHINNDEVLTLPDVFAKRYGKVVEVLVSLCCLASFLFLLAGNLVGMGHIIGYTFHIQFKWAVWFAISTIWMYTATGGLFAVAYTDVVQGLMGWSGCMVAAYYLLANAEPQAPPPSIGFPNYTYPDNIGDNGVCDMYKGIPCINNASNCCYNATLWCPTPDNCTTDNGAFPIGDQRIFRNQLTEPTALSPFPNAIFWDWCTIFILGFGNLAALDFQSRCMAAKNASAARWGCFFAAAVTLLMGLPFSYLGAYTRVYYGPDSPHAVFEADSCAEILGLPTCAAWVPDDYGFLMLMTNQAPSFLGGWCLVGIVAASMSTASGAILAMGTVFSHNIMRQFDPIYPDLITDDNLLQMARISTIPMAAIAGITAVYSGKTGYLLIVAFDIVLATAVVSLFGCFYAKRPSPRAAFCSVISGALTRIIMEFALPKDGFLIYPFNYPEFYNYGTAASANYPIFVDQPTDLVWNSTTDQCVQQQLKDYTGVDSLTSFGVSILFFLLVQFLERDGKVLFTLPGMQPYDKMGEIEIRRSQQKNKLDVTKPVDLSTSQLHEKLENEEEQDDNKNDNTKNNNQSSGGSDTSM